MTRNREDDEAAFDRRASDGDAPRRHVAQRHYDPDSDDELTTAIVFAIAEADAVAVTDLQSPLYEAVDVAAIEDALFGSGSTGRTGRGAVEFRYGDHLVNVESDGWIRIYESSDPESP